MPEGVSYPFPDEDEEDESEQDDSKAKAAFAQMRKELKASKKELEELRAFRVEQERLSRSTGVAETLKELGVNPRRAKFYPSDTEVSPEAVKAWAIEEEFIALEEGSEPATVLKQETGFTPTDISGAASPTAKVYTHDEFVELMGTDQNKAFQVFKAGRVKLDKLSEHQFYGQQK